MKKIIAAALSILVGACGFTIVDKRTDKRVEDLEQSVSSMQEEINSLHCLEEYSTTTEEYSLTTYTTEKSTTEIMTINPTTKATTNATTKATSKTTTSKTTTSKTTISKTAISKTAVSE